MVGDSANDVIPAKAAGMPVIAVSFGYTEVPAAEAVLTGRRPTPQLFRSAADTALADAAPLSHNGFKLPLARNAVMRALVLATGR